MESGRSKSMAKRLYDSNKFDDPWYRALSPVHKCFWDFLLCKCDHAGIWKVDMISAGWHIGSDIRLEQVLEVFKDRISVLNHGSAWFVPKFVLFQQNIDSLEKLNPKNPCHKSILKILVSRGLIGAKEGLGSPYSNSNSNVTDTSIDEVITAYNTITGSKCLLTTEIYREMIGSRLKEGHTVEQCKEVIQRKYDTWKDNDKMCKYIRIKTLFAQSNFDTYLNEKGVEVYKLIAGGYIKVQQKPFFAGAR